MMCVLCRLRVCVVDNGDKRERKVDNDMMMCYHCSLVVGCNTLPQYRGPVFLDCSSCTYVLVAGVSSFHSFHPKLISVFLTHGNPGTLLRGFTSSVAMLCACRVMSCMHVTLHLWAQSAVMINPDHTWCNQHVQHAYNMCSIPLVR
jgi:hypothetical protein